MDRTTEKDLKTNLTPRKQCQQDVNAHTHTLTAETRFSAR